MAKYRLKLNLPSELNMAHQRVLEGTTIVVTSAHGYEGKLSATELAAAQADPYIIIEQEPATVASEKKTKAVPQEVVEEEVSEETVSEEKTDK